MSSALSQSLNTSLVAGFLVYIVVALVLFALFQWLYTRLTPHQEFAEIRQGNTAAAIALGGSLIGFALPASNIIAYSIGVLDVVVWVLIAAVVQLLAFFGANLALGKLSERIARGELAAAIYAAAISISIGLLNAACMTPAN